MGPLPKFDRQTRNLVRLADDLAQKRTVWQSRPYTLEFATNNVCNLRCVMCPQHDGLPVEKVDASTAARVLDEFLPEGGILTPLALSEPFAGDMDLYVRKCEEHDAYLNLITNATLFTEERLARVMPRVDHLWISIESPRPDVYEVLREGASFEKVVDRCRIATRMAAAHGVPVGFVTILMKPVLPDLVAYVHFAKDLGATHVHVLELLPNYPRFDTHRVIGAVPLPELLALRDACLAAGRDREIGVKFEMAPPLGAEHAGPAPAFRLIYPELVHRLHGEIFRQHGHFCHHVASYMKVDTDGTVYPCCRAPDELRMGNVHETTLASIWNGPRYQELRARMHAGDLPAPCRGCSVLEGTPHYRRPGEPIPEDDPPWGAL